MFMTVETVENEKNMTEAAVYIIRVGRLGFLLKDGKIGSYGDGLRHFADKAEAIDKALWIGGTVRRSDNSDACASSLSRCWCGKCGKREAVNAADRANINAALR